MHHHFACSPTPFKPQGTGTGTGTGFSMSSIQDTPHTGVPQGCGTLVSRQMTGDEVNTMSSVMISPALSVYQPPWLWWSGRSGFSVGSSRSHGGGGGPGGRDWMGSHSLSPCVPPAAAAAAGTSARRLRGSSLDDDHVVIDPPPPSSGARLHSEERPRQARECRPSTGSGGSSIGGTAAAAAPLMLLDSGSLPDLAATRNAMSVNVDIDPLSPPAVCHPLRSGDGGSETGGKGKDQTDQHETLEHPHGERAGEDDLLDSGVLHLALSPIQYGRFLDSLSSAVNFVGARKDTTMLGEDECLSTGITGSTPSPSGFYDGGGEGLVPSLQPIAARASERGKSGKGREEPVAGSFYQGSLSGSGYGCGLGSLKPMVIPTSWWEAAVAAAEEEGISLQPVAASVSSWVPDQSANSIISFGFGVADDDVLPPSSPVDDSAAIATEPQRGAASRSGSSPSSMFMGKREAVMEKPLSNVRSFPPGSTHMTGQPFSSHGQSTLSLSEASGSMSFRRNSLSFTGNTLEQRRLCHKNAVLAAAM